jgi:hypothetical protein
MGYGIDGTFRPRAVAELLQEQNAEIIMLSEIDRGWLLNGGQDQLRILARLLNMQLTFGPAGDQVWGDAILSRTPLTNVRSVRLPAYDSLTGAQVPRPPRPHLWGRSDRVHHIQPDSSGTSRAAAGSRHPRLVAEERATLTATQRSGARWRLQPRNPVGVSSMRSCARPTARAIVDALNEARPFSPSSDDLDADRPHP